MCSRSAVALEGEDVLADPEDALNALSDRREVEAFSGRVLSTSSRLSWKPGSG
jgi:hypothetical protein